MKLDVHTKNSTYPIYLERGVLNRAKELIGAANVFLISDDGVPEKWRNILQEQYPEAHMHVFPNGEASKNLDVLQGVLKDMLDHEISRKDTVITLGGGVCGDLGGFAAACYMRGIRYVNIPTTTLSQIDSSVGGKTAVDLEAGKNLAGAFFQPSLVVADVDCLDTLTPELFTDSCGEVIKHGVIRDEALFRSLAAHPINAEGFDRQELADVIRRNVQIKRDVVDADERERGLRQILNFGHTIGHAIEAASDFALGHGSSVAAGMCCIARASARMGWCAQDVADDIVAAVAAYGLPTDTAVDHDTLLSFATHDKKRHGSTVNVVVPTRIGAVEVRTVSLPEFRHLVDLGCGTGAA